MPQRSVAVTIKGVSALLMHAHPMQEIEALEKKPPAEQAELAAYRDADSGQLYIPGFAVWRCLVSAAAYSKGKGRASLTKVAAASLLVDPEHILLGVKEYAVDSRHVVIPATRGHVMRHRPRLDQWQASFILSYDDTLMTEKQARDIVDNAGARVGLLEFRPERKGPFGRFMVILWKPVTEQKTGRRARAA